MHVDVGRLDEFYRRTRLGQLARRAVTRALREEWPETTGLDVAAVGFATPFLRPFLGEARRVVSFMPAAQGCVAWPADGDNATALVEESRWPLPDCCVDRLVLMHAAETSDNLSALMGEARRVLRPEGRLLLVVTNRHGLWAWFESTPLGHGRPFSAQQVRKLLTAHDLAPVGLRHVLYQPPWDRRWLLRGARFFNATGRRLMAQNSALLMVEAQKQLLAIRPKGHAQRVVQAIPGLAMPPPIRPAVRAANDLHAPAPEAPHPPQS
ncbi:MAG: class I SAM-dependent methyltransferase [Pseudomonadota bacterium]